jgi:hypothetical protein
MVHCVIWGNVQFPLERRPPSEMKCRQGSEIPLVLVLAWEGGLVQLPRIDKLK